jgi:3-hydroxyisobutyrate dehydrogenase
MDATQPALRRIGFVGLGRMGGEMAARLATQGYELALYDTDEAALRSFVAAHGGRACATVAAAAQGADALIAMLPSDDAVRAVMREAATALAPGAIAVDMGTTSPGVTIAVAEHCAAAGIRYVDAPVMGGTVYARDGSLDVMAGGDADAIDRCEPLFEALGRKVYRCGGVGSGHTLKALANLVNAATLATLAEALALGGKAGLDAHLIADALAAMCTGRQHPLEKKIVPQVLTRRYDSGMSLGLTAKDLSIAAALGTNLDTAAPIAALTHRLYAQAVERYGATADQTEIARGWEVDQP